MHSFFIKFAKTLLVFHTILNYVSRHMFSYSSCSPNTLEKNVFLQSNTQRYIKLLLSKVFGLHEEYENI